MDKQSFVNKVNHISDLSKVWLSTGAHRNEAIQKVCKEFLESVGSDGLDFIHSGSVRPPAKEAEVVNKDPWALYKEWHKRTTGALPLAVDKMTPLSKQKYDNWMGGYNAS